MGDILNQISLFFTHAGDVDQKCGLPLFRIVHPLHGMLIYSVVSHAGDKLALTMSSNAISASIISHSCLLLRSASDGFPHTCSLACFLNSLYVPLKSQSSWEQLLGFEFMYLRAPSGTPLCNLTLPQQREHVYDDDDLINLRRQYDKRDPVSHMYGLQPFLCEEHIVRRGLLVHANNTSNFVPLSLLLRISWLGSVTIIAGIPPVLIDGLRRNRSTLGHSCHSYGTKSNLEREFLWKLRIPFVLKSFVRLM